MPRAPARPGRGGGVAPRQQRRSPRRCGYYIRTSTIATSGTPPRRRPSPRRRATPPAAADPGAGGRAARGQGGSRTPIADEVRRGVRSRSGSRWGGRGALSTRGARSPRRCQVRSEAVVVWLPGSWARAARRPTRTDPVVVARVEALRRDRKLPPRLIVEELAADGIEVSPATVHRWLRRLGISRLRDLDVTGNSHRQIRRTITERPGQLVHLDVKKIGAIPTGGGWRVHGAAAPRTAPPAGNGSATATGTPPSTPTPGSRSPSPCPTNAPSPRPGSSAGPRPSSPPTAAP